MYKHVNETRKNLGVAQLVARYLGVVEAASSSLVTQTRRRFVRISSFLLFSRKSSRNLAFSQYKEWACSSLLRGLNKPIFRL